MSLSTSGQISFSYLNSALRITNGNLGIDITAPSFKVDVNGSIKGTMYTGENMSLSGNVNANNISITGGIAATGVLTNGGFDFILGNNDQVSRGNSGNSRALVKQVGNKLIVNFNNDFTGGVEVGSALKVTNSVFTTSTSDGSAKYGLINTTGSFEMGINASTINNGASYLLDYRARDLSIGTNNTEVIRITSSGNVGINTASASEKLDVRGNLRVGNSTQSNYITFHGVSGDGSGSGTHTYIGERLYAGNDFSELLLFKGNDPAVTSGPDRIRLLAPEIDFDTYTTFVSGTFDGVGTYGTTQMTITTSGSICMGTTRTSAKLNVGAGIDLDGSTFIRGYGVGPLTIDPNFTSNNYIQMYDEVRMGVSATNTILKETTATMGSTFIKDQLTIAAFNQPLLRFERAGTRFDFEMLLEPNTADLIFRGGADGTGAALTRQLSIIGGVISTGSMGLSATTTTGPLLINSSVNRTLAYAWLAPGGSIGTTGNQTNAYSLYAAARIACSEFNAYSDERIKTNIIDVNDSSALETIRQIQPKRYNYIDTEIRSEEPVWGFVAQQVESVLDYSVNKVNEYVPNIYGKANVTHNTDGSILTLVTGTTNVLDITKAVDDKIQIKIYVDDDKGCIKEVYVKEIINTTQIKLEESLDIKIKELFIYGQKVNDFHALNKDAIFTVYVAALQEVDRQMEDIKSSLYNEQTIIDTLNQQVQNIMSR